MTHVLACTDGSVYAHSVYDHAAWAATRTEASVEVLHVIDHKKETAGVADVDAAKSQLALARGRGILEDAAQRLRERGIESPKLTQRHGSLIETLAEIEEAAALVVIGKRGEAADFATLHLGANLERVVRGSRHPVLVTSRAFEPIQSVLIAYDGGPSARKAVKHAADGRLLKGLDVHLLTVGPASPRNQESLALAREDLAHAGITARTTLRDGEPEEVIARVVEEEGVDLLVVGAYGHSRIRRLLVGSTTTELIRTCRIPLLMFR